MRDGRMGRQGDKGTRRQEEQGSGGAGERGLCHSERSEESRGGERGSKERLLAAWDGRPHDHVPLTTWCFGLQAPPHLRWERDGQERTYWYSLRMEHIHTLPQPSSNLQPPTSNIQTDK